MNSTFGPVQPRSWRERVVVPLVLFVVFFGLLGSLSWERFPKQSADPHFVYLANAWLDGSLQLQKAPPHRNDWASYQWMRLRSGQELKGVWLDRNTGRFRTLQGEVFVVDLTEQLLMLAAAEERFRKLRATLEAPRVFFMVMKALTEQEKKDKLSAFMKAHPEMDFS